MAGCGDGIVSGVAPILDPNTPTLSVVVGDYPELATTGAIVRVTNTFVALKRTGPTTFAAYHMACTHAGCLTSIVGNEFHCGCHGSQFDAAGDVLKGPARKSLTEFVTSYNPGTDTVTIN